ncbi:hypothetical protein [Haladaptatus salinisoli]|uniref:hypothetical protein n=1 Tax=Haladaptatus salinisoli TaxID=2884876 RepID=UPI001D0B110F|nr:hypothetical protein [Haladaptatus salinisoli]
MGRKNADSDIDVPDQIADELSALDDGSLREAISYAQTLLEERTEPTTQIEEGPGEEIISIKEQDGYTLVTKKQPCAEGCDNCPHGPYLYRVRVEQSPVDGKPKLHWSFLGRVEAGD